MTRPFFDTSIVDELPPGCWSNHTTHEALTREDVARWAQDIRDRVDATKRRWARASGSAAEPDCG